MRKHCIGRQSRSLFDPRGHKLMAAQTGNEGLRLPLAERGVGHEPLCPQAAPAQRRHVGLDTCLVDEHETPKRTFIVSDKRSLRWRHMKGWRLSRPARRAVLTSARSFYDASKCFFIGKTVSAQELGQIGRDALRRPQPSRPRRHGDVRLRRHLVANGFPVGIELARALGTSLPAKMNRTRGHEAGLHPHSH
jgi:hypothetical protein